ncbi:hypothetical protein CI109_100101 [Kwoniella shandongensis]|uniref:Uncharacterized protein n=1 Tax=Kwoniella shandongensis TaxID=1734106 RepID=A0A5M6BNX3_9TREE|nr:uncharacterized protein CI109_007242 [Kwoniella shandongensis]KAA5524407.1 hypothetical protein CI109_007242 [Kwoniella shandongensis]
MQATHPAPPASTDQDMEGFVERPDTPLKRVPDPPLPNSPFAQDYPPALSIVYPSQPAPGTANPSSAFLFNDKVKYPYFPFKHQAPTKPSRPFRRREHTVTPFSDLSQNDTSTSHSPNLSPSSHAALSFSQIASAPIVSPGSMMKIHTSAMLRSEYRAESPFDISDEEAENERVKRQRAERERAERQRAERQRAERQRAERERPEGQRAERERAEKERKRKEEMAKHLVKELQNGVDWGADDVVAGWTQDIIVGSRKLTQFVNTHRIVRSRATDTTNIAIDESEVNPEDFWEEAWKEESPVVISEWEEGNGREMTLSPVLDEADILGQRGQYTTIAEDDDWADDSPIELGKKWKGEEGDWQEDSMYEDEWREDSPIRIG